MSLIDSKWPPKKYPPLSGWIWRPLLIVLGVVTVLIGLGAIQRGYWWIRSYNAVIGRVGIGPSLDLVPIGILFVLVGVIPMPRWKKKEKSKNDIYEIH